MWKIFSLEVLHIEIAQKLQNLEILLNLSNFLIGLQFLLIFLVIFGKDFIRGPNELELILIFRGIQFLSSMKL